MLGPRSSTPSMSTSRSPFTWKGLLVGCLLSLFAGAPGFITGQIWLSAFVAWLLKAVTLQYGGPGLFAQLRPFFPGLILGETTTGGVWLVIDGITGNYGNRITAM